MSDVARTLDARPLRRFKPYPAYKDSGVECLGEIPAHWDVNRLKTVAVLHTGGTPSGVLEEALDEDGVPWVKPDHLQGDRGITMPGLNLARAAAEAIGTLRAGSVLVCGIGTVGKTGHAPCDVCTNQQINGITFHPLVFDRYAQYVAVCLEQEFCRRANKVTIAICNKTEMAEVQISLPPAEEQRAIAAFLDRETARIDALVAKKERLIELLQEKRIALITRAVTKGLDPTVPMKDSGVEWLGEIPAHWEVKRLKHLADIASGFTPPASFDRSVGDYPVYGSNGLIGFCDQFFVREQTLAVGRVGASGLVNVIPAEAWVSDNALLLAKLRRAALLPWVRYVLETMNLGALAAKNAQPIITGTFLGNQALAMPPEPEQRTIAAFLDGKTARIDALIAKVREAIERLKELRTALISAAVTGKIDVREEAA